MAMSQEHGSTLQEVQQLMKKNQVRDSSSHSIKVTDRKNTHLIFFCFHLWTFIHCFTVKLLSFFRQNLKLNHHFLFIVLSRRFRGNYRATRARLKMSWREQESLHLFAAQKQTTSGQVTISWHSCGVSSGWKLKGGSWSLMPCTRLSSTSLTQRRWRPGWVSRSSTWWMKRKGRFVNKTTVRLQYFDICLISLSY